MCELPGRSAIIFLTVCTAARKPILACDDVHEGLRSAWQQADTWLVGCYLLMPDHLHLFCAPGGKDAPALDGWVAYWKSLASREWPRPHEHPIWQAKHWDRQLRTSESYSEKWEYVRQNPVRAGLVTRAEEWKYRGELNEFRFRDAK